MQTILEQGKATMAEIQAKAKNAKLGKHPSLCSYCVRVHEVTMLTGYCLTACVCDSCGRLSDLAMCRKP